MPSSPHDSSDSPPPSVTPSSRGGTGGAIPAVPRLAWRTNAWLFVATVASVFVTTVASDPAAPLSREALLHGAEFTGALLSILLAHEFGHFIAARIHRVDATLPFFIPMPLLSPFGTMGAVIRMRGVIPTRKALLDIGASGPLAGMALAVPMYIWGVAHSSLTPVSASDHMIELGDSLLLRALDHLFGPATAPGTEVLLSPVAFAAWAGMFVTMINLLPVGQLDGGHVAYALFGPRQDRIAQWVHRSMLVFFFVSLAGYTARDLRAGLGVVHFGQHVGSSLFWLVWFEILAVLGAVSSRGRAIELPSRAVEPSLGVRTRLLAIVGLAILASVGLSARSFLFWIAWLLGLVVLLVMEAMWGVLRPNRLLDHPPTGSAPLDPGRAAVAIFTLLLFAALFMPAPISM
jgi:membrane-associated protease RseP (regulator of RpoE activity)